MEKGVERRGVDDDGNEAAASGCALTVGVGTDGEYDGVGGLSAEAGNVGDPNALGPVCGRNGSAGGGGADGSRRFIERGGGALAATLTLGVADAELRSAPLST